MEGAVQLKPDWKRMSPFLYQFNTAASMTQPSLPYTVASLCTVLYMQSFIFKVEKKMTLSLSYWSTLVLEIVQNVILSAIFKWLLYRDKVTFMVYLFYLFLIGSIWHSKCVFNIMYWIENGVNVIELKNRLCFNI